METYWILACGPSEGLYRQNGMPDERGQYGINSQYFIRKPGRIRKSKRSRH
jgi:hypothetical protein